MPPRIILSTIGSLGDLHPFIALGLALRERGARVVLASAAEYRLKVECAGLEFRAVRPSFNDLQHSLGMDRRQLTHQVLARSDFLLRKLIMPPLRASYDDMLPIVQGANCLVSSSLAFGARLAAEKCAIPRIAVVLQPLMFLSAFDPPVIPKVEWLNAVLRALGPSATRPVLRFVKWALNAQLRPVRVLRRQIGLAPTRLNPLFEGQFSAGGALGLYSPVLGGLRPDYPRPTSLTGFAVFDSDDGGPAALSGPLQRFLEAGAPPLVFTLGSLIVNSPGAFFRESLAAARHLRKRAVLLVGETAGQSFAGCQGDDVHVTAYAPHSLLFPRAEAIVHQGGIGTLAQGLRSGRPQLIVPFYADQLDNAARAVHLGVARSLAPARYSADEATRQLGLLLSMPQYVSLAAQVRDRVGAEDGAGRAADIVLHRLESWAA